MLDVEKRNRDQFIRFLQLPSHKRTDKDISNYLDHEIYNINYLKKLNLTYTQSKRILASLKYEFHAQGTNVFHYGDHGEKFFMIIDG